MKRMAVVFALTTLGPFVVSGCAQQTSFHQSTPRMDAQFGQAVKRARAAQVIHPDGVVIRTEEGFAGRAAEVAMQGYYKAPAAAPAMAIPALPGMSPPAPGK